MERVKLLIDAAAGDPSIRNSLSKDPSKLKARFAFTDVDFEALKSAGTLVANHFRPNGSSTITFTTGSTITGSRTKAR